MTQKNISILALGDSYTIGEDVKREESWPYQLKDSLTTYGLSVKEPEVIAKTGWTTSELLEAIDKATPGRYTHVFLLAGVNNQYRGEDKERYRKEFRHLLDLAKKFSTNKVIVLSIPDWGVTPFAAASGRDQAQTGREIDEFNQINKEEAKQAGAAYIDVTPISRKAGSDTNLLASDGLHPSGKMYAGWVALIMKQIFM